MNDKYFWSIDDVLTRVVYLHCIWAVGRWSTKALLIIQGHYAAYRWDRMQGKEGKKGKAYRSDVGQIEVLETEENQCLLLLCLQYEMH